MTSSQQVYTAAAIGTHSGIGALIFVILFCLFRWRHRTFYRTIEAMFSIKHFDATLSNAREFIDIYGAQIDLSATVLGFLPSLALLIMATSVLSAAFVVFLSELILIHRYVSPNDKCPSDDDMDCYTTTNSSYLFCNSSDTRIDGSLGSLVCYRWVKQDIGAVDILNQAGLFGGLLQAFKWFVNIFLRWLLHVLQRRKWSLPGKQMIGTKVVDSSLRRRYLFKLCFKLLLVTLITLGPCVALILLNAKNSRRTGITMFVFGVLFLVAISGLLLLVTYESTHFKHGNIAPKKDQINSPIASDTATQPVVLQSIQRI